MNKIIVSRLCEAVSRTEQVGPSRVQEIISLSSVKYRRHIWNGGQLMDAPLDVAIAAQTCRVRKRALVVVRLVALSLSLDGEQCTLLLTRWPDGPRTEGAT